MTISRSVFTGDAATRPDHTITRRVGHGARCMFAIPLLALSMASASVGCVSSPDAAGDLASNQRELAASPSLGSASSFAVLAKAAVTCTDGTISGDVGTLFARPTGSVTLTKCPVVGATDDVGTATSIAAYDDSVAAYTALGSPMCDRMLTGTLADVILPPGVYCFAAAAALTGTLTLDGPSTGEWVFVIGTGGTGALAATGLSVVMAPGANPCNVTWRVPQAATLTDSAMVGTILSGEAITLTRGTLRGRAFAQADVTITGTAVTGCTDGGVDDGGVDDGGADDGGVGDGGAGDAGVPDAGTGECDDHHKPCCDKHGECCDHKKPCCDKHGKCCDHKKPCCDKHGKCCDHKPCCDKHGKCDDHHKPRGHKRGECNDHCDDASGHDRDCR